MKEICLCKVDELKCSSARVFEVDNQRIALFHRPDGFFALDDLCPHRGAPLSDGLIDTDEVTCPWHQWNFSLKTGKCSNIPGTSVRIYPTFQRDGCVWIEF